LTRPTHFRWRLLATFLVFLTVYTIFMQRTGSNALSRLNLTFSLSYEGRLQIDHFAHDSIDKAYFNRHYYTDKAPGVSLLALPWFDFFRKWFRLDSVNTDTHLMMDFITWLINGVVNAPFSALLVVLIALAAYRFRPEGNRFWLIAYLFGLATLIWPYATLLFGHNVASCFSFAAFVLAFWVRTGDDSPWLLFLSGLSAGFAVIVEYPNGIIAVALLVYLWFTLKDRRSLLWFAAGGGIMLIGLLVYNTAAFGAPWHISYMYHAAPWGAEQRQGLLGVTVPTWHKFDELLFSPRGLFYLMPVAWLVPIAYWQMFRRKQWRPEFYLFLTISLLFLLLNSAYFYTMGGSVPGPRFLLVTFPYLFIPYLFIEGRWRWLLWPLAAVSGLIQFAIVDGNPGVGRFANPLLQYWLPRVFLEHQGVPLVPRLRWGIPYRWSIALIFLIVALGFLVWLWRVTPTRKGRAKMISLTALLLVLYLVFASPLDVRHPRQIPPTFLRPSPPVRDGGPLLPTDPF